MRVVDLVGDRAAVVLAMVLAVAPAVTSALAQQWPLSPIQQRAAGSITAHCGGGVTGGGGGTRILDDGAVTRLEQPRAGVPVVVTPLGRDPAAYRRWVAALEAAGFARLAEQRPGNLTCSLTQELNGRLAGVSWPGEAPPTRIPAAVRQVFSELRGWSPAQ